MFAIGASRFTGILLAFLLASDLVLGIRRGHREVEEPFVFGPACKKYEAGKCGLLHKSGLPLEPFCHPGNGTQQPCNFDTQSLLACPLPLEGKFVEKDAISHQCRMDEKAQRRTVFAQPLHPACGSFCCSGDLEGDFRFHESRKLTSLQFQPNSSSCHYHQYSWREAMGCLEGTKIVIAGDSIMRQVFNMAIALFRGQEVALDYNKHAHGRYRVCRNGDKLDFSTFEPNRWEIPIHETRQLFSPQQDDFEICSNKPVFEVDYIWAPRFMDLVPQLREYNEAVAKNSSQKVAYITFGGFWEDRTEISEEFFQTLDSIRTTASAVIMMGVPTVRLFGDPEVNARIRNTKMKDWAYARREEIGENVHYFDFDHIAHSQNAPPGLGSLNWHYQCFLDHNHLEEVKSAFGSLDNSWYWPEAPEYLYPSVWTEDGGKCTDDMDRNLWQILFNILCNSRDNKEL